MMRPWLPITLALLALAGCRGAEPTLICASITDPETGMQVAAHSADGTHANTIVDLAEGITRVQLHTSDPPRLAALWRDAEPTMRAVREVESSPCGLPVISEVTVWFADGSEMHRSTSCEGNALARLAQGILDASELTGATGTFEVEQTDMDRRLACQNVQ